MELQGRDAGGDQGGASQDRVRRDDAAHDDLRGVGAREALREVIGDRVQSVIGAE